MFKRLTDFSYVRSGKEAVGFYLAYFVLVVLCGALLGAVSTVLFTGGDSMQTGVRVGNIVAILIVLFLAIKILSMKKLTGDYKFIVIALLSGLFAVFGGALFGLLPVAYLSTVKSRK